MPTILIVDDQPLNRRLLSTVLDFGGYRVLEAEDGCAALALIRERKPDMIVTDILMPNMDGYELASRLHEDAALAGIPVAFYTASEAEREARTMAQQCGVKWIVSKPCEPETVLQTLREALGQRTAAQLEAVTVAGDPARLLQEGCRLTRELCAAEYAVVGILAEDGGDGLKHFFAGGRNDRELPQPGTVPARAGILGVLLTGGAPKRINGLEGDPQSLGLPAAHPAIHSFLGVPIAVNGRAYGWLYLADAQDAAGFGRADEEAAVAIASQLAAVCEKKA